MSEEPMPYDLVCERCEVKYKSSNPYRQLCPDCVEHLMNKAELMNNDVCDAIFGEALEIQEKNKSLSEKNARLKEENQYILGDHTSDVIEINELTTEIQNLKEKIDILENNKAHIPELAFRNGKAYCKKCGSDLE